MIELVDVTKRYPSRALGPEPSPPALAGLSAHFHAGELSAVAGPSGCGKSTLLRLVNRLLEPDSGEIFLQGRPARELDPILLRRRTGYVIQGIGLFPHMTVAENIGVVPALLGWERARTTRRIAELLELVRLPGSYAARWPRELSGGEAQRVGVARALAADPPLLLMDEPFGALDALTRLTLQDEFDRIRRELGKTVILVTHDLAEAFRLADRVFVLREGRLVREGTPTELAIRPGDPLIEEFLASLRALGRFIREAQEQGA